MLASVIAYAVGCLLSFWVLRTDLEECRRLSRKDIYKAYLSVIGSAMLWPVAGVWFLWDVLDIWISYKPTKGDRDE